MNRIVFAALWIYQRSGQMFCFAVGGAVCLQGGSSGDLAQAVAGGFLLMTGCALKALLTWQQVVTAQLASQNTDG